MPSIYNLALFLHVSGDIGIFAGIAIQLVCVAALRHAQTTDQARGLASLAGISDTLSITSALLTIASGLYMALTVWNLRTGWIAVSLASLILILPPLIRGIVEPRVRAIVKMAKDAPNGPLPEPLYARIHDPVLSAGLNGTAATVLGIVFLMTTKPALVDSIAVIAVALVLGIASALPLRRRPRLSRS